MAITTSLDIVNLSLTHLGAQKLAALNTTTEYGRVYSAIYPEALDELIREIRPNFAKKRAIFHQVTDADKTISAATAADPVEITSTSHGFDDDDVIAIYDVVGMTELNGKMFIVKNKTTHTFELTDLNGADIDGTDYETFVSGTCGLVSDPPAFGFDCRYLLPSDYILLLELNGNESLEIEHSIEAGELLTDEQEIQARYVAAITDVTKFDKDFVKVLVYKLNAEAAPHVTNQTSVSEKWEAKYEKELARAKGRKSQEAGSVRKVVANSWINARKA